MRTQSNRHGKREAGKMCIRDRLSLGRWGWDIERGLSLYTKCLSREPDYT